MEESVFSLKASGNALPFYFKEDAFYFIDQRYLPLETRWVKCVNFEDIADVISTMVVRGAPAIGISASIGLALTFSPIIQTDQSQKTGTQILETFQIAKKSLEASRPTAKNLKWALDRMEQALVKNLNREKTKNKELYAIPWIYSHLLDEAFAIWKDEIESNKKIADYGIQILPPGGVLTHCNTGALATGGIGTALGIIKKKYHALKEDISQVDPANPNLHVYVDETRPYLQGSRLTAFELYEEKIPFDLITDSSAAFVMSKGKINSVIVGADRIAANGDTANKIGTLNLAILANFYQVPFFVAAPLSTFDLEIESGSDIPIEERGPSEITHIGSYKITKEYPAYNPAFDITPHHLITAIITDKGIINSPDSKNIKSFYDSLQKG